MVDGMKQALFLLGYLMALPRPRRKLSAMANGNGGTVPAWVFAALVLLLVGAVLVLAVLFLVPPLPSPYQ